MDSRKTKQLIYGIGFIVVFAIILFFIIYFLFFKSSPNCFDTIQNQNELGIDCGGVCDLSCEQKNALPLEVSWIKKIKGDGNRIVILVEIKNPNFNYGTSDFTYILNVSDINGSRINSITGRSFIYPSETKYIFEIIDNNQIGMTEDLIFFNQTWKSKEDFKKPNIQVKSYNLRADNSSINIEGIIKNIDLIKVSKVILTAVIYDTFGTIKGASKTELENLNPTDERNFSLIFPKNIDINLIDQNKTKIFADAIR